MFFPDPNTVCLEDYPIHTVTGLVKQWLRELPEPLMTFNHYNDFLHAVGEFKSTSTGSILILLSLFIMYINMCSALVIASRYKLIL